MKPAPFDYLRPDSPEEAIEALGAHGDAARVLAGGQSLVAMLNMRLVEPRVLVDVSRIAALDYVAEGGGAIEVGASTTQADLHSHPDLARSVPLAALALPHVGHFQTRNRGTVCGSIAFADPSSELPLVLAALDGEVVLASTRGRRTLAAGDFQRGLLETAIEPDELIVAVRFPLAADGERFAFDEVSPRHGDFAIVALAARVRDDAVRIAVGGVADRPAVRDWPAIEGDALDDALNDLAWGLDAASDQHASARYRRDLVRRVGRRIVEEARACAA